MPRVGSAGHFRNFCFTVQNPHTVRKSWLGKFKSLNPNWVGYAILGDEVAPTTGTQHYQGFIHFKTAVSLAVARKRVNPNWISPCRGSPEQNRAYCSKFKKCYEVGVFPLGPADKQGKRTDLDAVHTDILAGKDFFNICC